MQSRRVMSRLKTGLLAAAATGMMLAAPSALAPASASDTGQVVKLKNGGASQRIKLGLNKSVVIDLPADAYDILVANPAVADAVTRTSRRIYLFGKQVGETNIFVFGEDGRQIVSLDLAIERDVAGLEDYLERFIAGSNIKVELINDNVVLTGTVQTPLDSSRAAQLAEVFVTGGEATTGNFATTAGGGAQGGDVAIDNPDSQRRTSKIVNLLSIVGEDQVTLKVTVAEVQRSVMKQLGVDLLTCTLQAGGNCTPGFNSTPFSGLDSAISANSTIRGSIGSTSITSYIQAMEAGGVLRTLAEPNLTAISGEQATFRAGGDVTIITGCGVDPDTGGVTFETERMDYGIGLEFKPVVLSPGRISLKVRTSVSEPTTQNSTNFCGAQGMGLRKRLADTTVELPSGGTMMIAGLLQDDIRQTSHGTPGLSKIPVLGTLFRSKAFQRNETELVILVTPYIARPTARNDMARPDDNFTPASDGASLFLNKVNRVYGTSSTKLPNGRYHGVVGFIYK
ncbi:MAG: type II and III secretion system protein family protein [Rhizobiaceae bacterium]|nr:type II and III secretion system protein family protein [Rhizobiaceae bacterium]